MNFSEYLACDATELAALVAKGDVSSGELLDIALGQYRRAQPKINAVTRLLEPQARAQLSGGLSGPFAGVPFLIKDLIQDYAGAPTSGGSRAFANAVPAQHATIVRRFIEAGLVIFAKTNTPELGLKAVTDPVLFGRTSNPWNFEHSCGGSSGGAAATVAAGVAPMAGASDGGGSIRIPAACCGLFGLKPSRGRISVSPASGEYWFGAASEGVISRSVRDTARALDFLQGPEPGDPFVIARPETPYAEAMQRDPGRLRIGFSTRSPIGMDVHPDAVAAVDQATTLLRGLGHDVEEAEPAVDGAALAQSYLHLYFGAVPAAVAQALAAGARRDDFEVLTRVIATLGEATSAGVFTTQLQRWNEYARALGQFHKSYDLFLTPTLAHPPIRHGEGDMPAAQAQILDLLERSGVLGLLARAGLLASTINDIARKNLRYVPFTQLANLTGVPAMSVPLYWTPDGLPLGVQFVAPFGAEDRLLQLARQLEQAQPWFKRLPDWVAKN